jgi:hypothetical protein
VTGAKRHQPGTPEAEKRDLVRHDGTLEDVVRRALTLAKRFESLPVQDPLDAQRVSLAAARLHKIAIDGLRARSTVGDLPTRGKGNGPEIADEALPGAPPSDTLGELERELGDRELDS